MPVTLDASPFTSVTVSPIEPQDTDDVPIELKVPLPSSHAGSDEEGENEVQMKVASKDLPSITMAEEEALHLKSEEQSSSKLRYDSGAESQPAYGQELPNMSLDELAHLVQLEAYQRRQTVSAQTRMDRLTLKRGLDRRMISTMSIAYGNMIDQYKTDDQAGFAMIYEACDQLKASCATADPVHESFDLRADSDLWSTEANLASRSWLQRLSSDNQRCIVTFLTQIRSDPNFLSDRISNLSPSELTSLTSSYHPAGIDYSVLQNHSHGKTHFYSKDSQMMNLSRRMDNLRRFHDEDPLYALLYSVFDSSAKPGSQEDIRRNEIWSTTCARNFTEAFSGTRSGSEEFAIAVLDGFTNFQEWPLKPKMESYLMRILVEGSFLLDHSSQSQANPKEPIEMHHATTAIREAEFFEKALTDLFELLTTQLAQQPQQAVPESALAFVHATLRRIKDPDHRLRATRFIVCRWYFAMFISSIVLHPEGRGILMTHHVGDTARQQILQQLVLRLQQRVFDVALPGNGHTLVNPDIRDGIMTIFQIFEPLDIASEEPSPHILEFEDDASTRFLMVSALDTVGLIQTLYPDRAPKIENHGPETATTFSTRPSTAGSSTLIAGSSDVGSAEAPSTAPSSISNLEKLANREPSAAAPLTEEQDFGYPSKGESENVPTEPAEAAQQDLAPQIQRVCRKLKDMLAHQGHSDRTNAWTFLYYSQDESPLSVGQRLSIESGVSKDTSHHKSHREDGFARDLQGLKVAVVKLLNENNDCLSDFRHSCTIRQNEDRPDPLECLIESAASKARSSLDFGAAHFWWGILDSYRNLLILEPIRSLQTLLQEISENLTTAIGAAAKSARAYDIQCRSLVRLQHSHNKTLTAMEEQRSALRIKMWYSSDVRHSATYEEALLVTRALRTMASSKRSKQGGGLSNWARQRLRGSSIHDRSEAQTLEALTASKEHGGLSKLADEQVELTSRWLTRNSIENFCKGEEKIHRFCYEIQRSASKLAGPTLLENPVLWSSNLFRSERITFASQPRTASAVPPHASNVESLSSLGYNPLQTTALASLGTSPKGLGLSKAKSPTSSYGGFWPINQAPRAPTGATYHPALPPTPTSPPMTWSRNVFMSGPPLHTFTPPLSAHNGYGRHSAHSSNEGEPSPEKKIFAEQIKKILCSLLLSDLGYLLWTQGSETDAWINEHIVDDKSFIEQGNENTAKRVSEASSDVAQPSDDRINLTTEGRHGAKLTMNDPTTASYILAGPSNLAQPRWRPRNDFPFLEAYTSLLSKFSLNPDPYAKLYALYELEDLAIKSLYDLPMSQTTTCSRSTNVSEQRRRPTDFTFRNKNVPRTKATSLEEVIANCTERRAGTLRFNASERSSIIPGFALEPSSKDIPSTDDIVEKLLSIFRSTNLRPATLFRDLQYIATFIPSEILDQTAQGKAFWDVALAALALKDDLCDVMIARANDITACHIPSARPSNHPIDNTITSYTLRDAANLWLITAKEGSPVAARELGLFYLTHPELLSRNTMPFSKAKDVFKSVNAMDYRTGDKERGALDPYTFAVVRHWMEIAANGGDKDARDFLKGSGDVGTSR